MNLSYKKVLITAGPTWVPIDRVRVISNLATGETGILLAEGLQNLGAKVTLLLGPIEACCLNKKIKVIRFQFFDELKNIIIKELKTKNYNIFIHSAAVSDYRPKKKYTHKVRSGIRQWRLDLVPTPKIIDLVRKIKTKLFLVGFKFEPEAKKSMLISKARELLKHAQANLVVANTIDKRKRYTAYILGQDTYYGPLTNRVDMVRKLMKIIGDNLCCH